MTVPSIQRLLAPRTIALVGGAWADAVDNASRTIGFTGQVWRVHPKRPSTPNIHYFRSIDELPGSPDATFVAAPNSEVPNIAAALVRRRAGGFVCFAAGFSETATDRGNQLTHELLESAGDLPFFGPNCYGFINFFDGVALWPDQVVGVRRERGIALVCQSGTIALNLLFNQRSLPIGYVLTVGNQTRLAVEDMIELLCQDDRVTAFGLYVEGIKDPLRFAHAVEKARLARKPIAIVKAGRTEAAARTARSHTGSLSGADAVFDAFCRQAGLARCDSLATLCETLKVLHEGGPLPGRRVLILGASGGDMAMTADAARDLPLEFPPIPADSVARLREILSDKVHIANPFDFHTHIWFDRPAMRAMFSVAQRSGFDAVGLMLDCPPADQADPASYIAVIDEFIAASADTPTRAAIISSLPESLFAETRERCFAAGIVPLQGQRQALEALALAAAVGKTWSTGPRIELRLPNRPWEGACAIAEAANEPPSPGRKLAPMDRELAPSDCEQALPGRELPPPGRGAARARKEHTLTEHEGKAALAAFGVRVPRSAIVAPGDAAAAAGVVGFPVVMKAASPTLEHKSDVGGVILNIRTHTDAEAAAERLARLSDILLVEEMATDAVAEILIGMTADAQFGQVLVIGAGGILTELLRDTVTLLPPFTPSAIEAAIKTLSVHKLLTGFRGRPLADIPALVETALACTRYAAANVNTLVELDINPVIVRPAGRGAIAVDALIRLG